MKIPESIRIAGVEYKLIENPHLTKGNTLAYAHIDYDNTLIEFSSTVPISHEKKCLVLWHEILHGFSHHYDIDLGDDEESVIDKLASGIYQVLQDNGRRFYNIIDPEAAAPVVETEKCDRACKYNSADGCVLEPDHRPCMIGNFNWQKQDTKKAYTPLGSLLTGFMYLRCPECNADIGFCLKSPRATYICKACGKQHAMDDMDFLKVLARCQCGRHFTYWTNITEDQFEIPCIDCGAPMPVKYNDKIGVYIHEVKLCGARMYPGRKAEGGGGDGAADVSP